jgi:hypothetical protein
MLLFQVPVGPNLSTGSRARPATAPNEYGEMYGGGAGKAGIGDGLKVKQGEGMMSKKVGRGDVHDVHGRLGKKKVSAYEKAGLGASPSGYGKVGGHTSPRQRRFSTSQGFVVPTTDQRHTAHIPAPQAGKSAGKTLNSNSKSVRSNTVAAIHARGRMRSGDPREALVRRDSIDDEDDGGQQQGWQQGGQQGGQGAYDLDPAYDSRDGDDVDEYYNDERGGGVMVGGGGGGGGGGNTDPHYMDGTDASKHHHDGEDLILRNQKHDAELAHEREQRETWQREHPHDAHDPSQFEHHAHFTDGGMNGGSRGSSGMNGGSSGMINAPPPAAARSASGVPGAGNGYSQVKGGLVRSESVDTVVVEPSSGRSGSSGTSTISPGDILDAQHGFQEYMRQMETRLRQMAAEQQRGEQAWAHKLASQAAQMERTERLVATMRDELAARDRKIMQVRVCEGRRLRYGCM